MTLIYIPEIVEKNDLTIKENNLNSFHKITIGSLVEIVYDEENQKNGLRLFVVNHSRDCDGTPLYDLSFNLNAQKELNRVESEKTILIKGLYGFMHGSTSGAIDCHYNESSLVVIKMA